MIDEPHDLLTIACRGSGARVRVTGDAAGDVPADDRNLAARAALALARVVPEAGDCEIVVHKGVPAGAGLGGGSSDAAAVLDTLGRACGVDHDDVRAIAAGLGSDVPVCLHGGPAWMRGRGERVEPLQLATLRVLVVVPPFGLSTPEVYRAWDALGGPRDVREVPAPPSIASVLPRLVNDLEPAAERVEPGLADFRQALEAAAGAPALLAGSGSAHAVVCDDTDDWRARAASIEAVLGLRVYRALTLAPRPAW